MLGLDGRLLGLKRDHCVSETVVLVNGWFGGVGCKGAWRTLDAEVTAEIRLGQVNVFDLDLDFVDLPVGLLRSFEFAPGAQEGGCGVG